MKRLFVVAALFVGCTDASTNTDTDMNMNTKAPAQNWDQSLHCEGSVGYSGDTPVIWCGDDKCVVSAPGWSDTVLVGSAFCCLPQGLPQSYYSPTVDIDGAEKIGILLCGADATVTTRENLTMSTATIWSSPARQSVMSHRATNESCENPT